MAANLVLRFWWVIGLFHYSFEDHNDSLIKNLDILHFVGMMAEAFRRTFWSLIRVENEFFNNFEAYRSIPTIPNLFEEIDDKTRT